MRNKILELILITLMISTLFVQAFTYAENSGVGSTVSDATINDNIIIVMFGNSVEELAALKVIESSGIEYTLVLYSVDIKNIISTYGFIFYIGHGMKDGIKNGNNVISYSQLNEIALGKQTFYIACNSLQERQDTISFPDSIDAIHASAYALMNLGIIFGDLSFIFRMFNVITDRSQALEAGEVLLLLDTNADGHHVSIRDQHYKANWGTTREHILWIMMAWQYASQLLIAVGLGAGAITALEWPALIAASFASLSTAHIVVLLLVVVAILSMRFATNAANRVDGDVLIGIGAQALPFPYMKAWMDHGDDGHGSKWKGWFPFVDPTFLGPLFLYAAFSPLSNSWHTIVN